MQTALSSLSSSQLELPRGASRGVEGRLDTPYYGRCSTLVVRAVSILPVGRNSNFRRARTTPSRCSTVVLRAAPAGLALKCRCSRKVQALQEHQREANDALERGASAGEDAVAGLLCENSAGCKATVPERHGVHAALSRLRRISNGKA